MMSNKENFGQTRVSAGAFAKKQWYGQQASDTFFSLKDDEAFRGVGHDAVLMPVHTVSVSREANSGGAVIEAYPHGLSYGNMMTLLLGYLSFGAVAVALPLAVMFSSAIRNPHIGGTAAFGTAVMLAFALVMSRFDILGYRYQPTLFDREAGKVHVLLTRPASSACGPSGAAVGSTKSFPMTGLAYVVRSRGSVRSPAPWPKRMLRCNSSCWPDRKIHRWLGQYGLGLTSSAIAVQPLLDTWEHIRRFMEHEGPLFVESDGPNAGLFQLSLGACLCFGQPFIGPGSRPYWEHPDLGAVLWQIIALPLWPLTALYGLIRWTCFRIKSKPAWPAEVLASVGGAALSGKELEAWRGIVPARMTEPGAGKYQPTLARD